MKLLLRLALYVAAVLWCLLGVVLAGPPGVKEQPPALSTAELLGLARQTGKPIFIKADAEFNSLFQLTSASSSERAYDLFLIFTSLTERCPNCMSLHPTIELAASKLHTEQAAGDRKNTFIAVLDYADVPSIFRRVGVQTVPMMLYFGHKKPLEPVPFTVDSSSPIYVSLGNFLREQTGLAHFTLTPPPNYFRLGMTALVGLASVVLTVVFWRKFLTPVLRIGPLLGLGALFFSVYMLSGHMWNRIRKAPRSVAGSLISPGFQTQNVAETNAVAVIYALAALALLGLTVHIPSIPSGSFYKRRGFVLFYAVLLLVTTSVSFAIFRAKIGTYPLRLLF
ncbi:hypothetical protein H696_01733 [Fonticula alba]|uniref:Thioredoxin domain-containing protein n=1 Tax=Fonticula alba TaxID=691883 RepID=A0A058ZD76_FONAL|nr:hypothetical protein H696_01733 [Fonticula alba]KCV72339.1 hypothetical protein H696_01733 [Fonticula alba]|eukprot:XP_009493917.1 hypothetical protein H696_01733 [Fonticula alba]